MKAIELRNLTKIYRNRHIALSGVNLTVPEGSVFGLLGPNGAGKTTAIRLMLGLQRPTAGTAWLFGEKMTPNASHLRRRIGYLPTHSRFPSDMTPITYLDMMGRLSGLPADQRKTRLAHLLRAVELLPATTQRLQSLSTGMTTRLGIAASLLHDPDLLIWDEPTVGLDPEGRRFTLDLIRGLAGEKTLLLSTHLLGDIDRICDHVGVLSEGKLVFSGPVVEMKRLVRQNEVELEVQGDLDMLKEHLGPWSEGRAELALIGQHTLRVLFTRGQPFLSELTSLLRLLSKHQIELLSVRSAGDQLEDAFLRRLEEERTRGFARAMDVEK
ncbi:MAG: ABC transporter ATP-binding protein [Dehalococcoidia bacterium]|nr:ABC transporter ATP-binding protein [Dehalococcoidia bacterium]